MRGFIATAPTYAQNLAGSTKSRISLCIDFLRIWARQGFYRKFYLSRLMRINPWILSPRATRIQEVEEQTPPDLLLPPLPTGRGTFLLSQVDRGRANSQTAKASPRTLDVSNPGRSQTSVRERRWHWVLAGASPPNRPHEYLDDFTPEAVETLYYDHRRTPPKAG